MPALSAYTNTENTSMVILQDKGFRVWCDDELEKYGCEKNGWDFIANSITELLGVVAIYEHHGSPKNYKEYWWRINTPWLISSVPKTKPIYTPIYLQEKS